LVGEAAWSSLAGDGFSFGANVAHFFIARKAQSNALRSAQVRRISWVLRGSAGLEAVRVASSKHRFRPVTLFL
jgi:hypothetical protein